MRHHLLASLVPSVLLLLCAANAQATENQPIAVDEPSSFGTTPARSKAQFQQQQSVPAPAVAQPQATDAPSTADEVDRFETADRHRSGPAPLAVDPPGDWAVLHAGLRPRLGTFGGIATLALAHARTETFYGGFSLSAVRNDAGTHIGLAQIALGRNLSDSFGGGFQLSISENRARNFIGLGQTALAYNRALDITAVTQLAIFNRAKSFTGVTQLGLYNRTDESFAGLAEIGAYNASKQGFSGIAQLGVVNGVGRDMFGDHDSGSKKERFAGLAQIGAIDSINGSFYGLAQVSAASWTSNDFRGLVQIGALGAGASNFKGLAQVGLFTMARDSVGLQIGAGTMSSEEHTGLQIGGVGNWAKNIDGAQIGVANIAERVRGVQIGVFNHTKSLRGMQIGLANHAEDGVLPWTALLNFGFGDALDDDDYAQQRQGKSTSARGSL